MFPPEYHYPVSPSRLQRIVDCPGSFRIAAESKTEQSQYAAEGSHLHAATEAYVKQWIKEGKQIGRLINPTVEPDIIYPPLNPEQVIAIENSLIYLGQVIRTCSDNYKIGVELAVTLAEYHSVLFECAGTCDIVLFDEENKIIHIIDWKFGQGILVEAQNNDQLYAYGTGAYLKLTKDVPLASDFSLGIHVVQPRINNYDSCIITTGEMIHWLDSRIVPGVSAAYKKHAPFNAGTKQCRWCHARFTCRARHNHAIKVAGDVFAAVDSLPDKVDTEDLVKVLDESACYTQYIKDIATHLQKRLETGEDVPGKKLVAGKSKRTWINEDEAQEWLLENIDYDKVFTVKLVSVAQAEKISRKIKNDDTFRTLIEKAPGKPTMVDVSDKRPALVYRTPSDIFNGV